MAIACWRGHSGSNHNVLFTLCVLEIRHRINRHFDLVVMDLSLHCCEPFTIGS